MRTQIHEQFAKRFHSSISGAPKLLTNAEVDYIETSLDTKLPTAYRHFVTRTGQVHTRRILDELSERGLDYPDIQDFLTSDEAVKNTKGYWAAGMPHYVIGFASDCMGNMIGFRRSSTQLDDAPVLFFDHDYVTVSEIAATFDAFLSWYLSHLRGS